jgi:hypothetical protein
MKHLVLLAVVTLTVYVTRSVAPPGMVVICSESMCSTVAAI